MILFAKTTESTGLRFGTLAGGALDIELTSASSRTSPRPQAYDGALRGLERHARNGAVTLMYRNVRVYEIVR